MGERMSPNAEMLGVLVLGALNTIRRDEIVPFSGQDQVLPNPTGGIW